MYKSKLAEELKFSLEPVAIFFTDEKPIDALQFAEGKRGCVASMLVASASRGKTAVFDENTYGCPGGGVGLCFGNTFAKRNHPTEHILSTGIKVPAEHEKNTPIDLERGERFFANPEVAKKWIKTLPFTETSKKYVVFKPLNEIDENNPPDIIIIFANPDQISALITMSGYNNGLSLNAIAPFGAACHSILFTYQEIDRENPKAILGFFDIAQRHSVPKDILTFTVPYKMFSEIEKSIPESCLTTHSWEKIRGR
ncbi:MAG: DUF169 domain-containing protein [Tannerella sp.]|jgi:uncharacterized protein (DUF169 family)|nr:DUF169 domain-containing protein [Tannerella sp.]